MACKTSTVTKEIADEESDISQMYKNIPAEVERVTEEELTYMNFASPRSALSFSTRDTSFWLKA